MAPSQGTRSPWPQICIRLLLLGWYVTEEVNRFSSMSYSNNVFQQPETLEEAEEVQHTDVDSALDEGLYA